MRTHDSPRLPDIDQVEPHVRGHDADDPVNRAGEHPVRVLPGQRVVLPGHRLVPRDDGLLVRVESVLQLRVRKDVPLLVGCAALLHLCRSLLPRSRSARAPTDLLRHTLREGIACLSNSLAV